MKDSSKEFKKRKSQDSFFSKAKLHSQLREQLKMIQPRKSQVRASASLLQIYPSASKEHKKRVNSLEIAASDLALPEDVKPAKSTSKAHIKSAIGHCFSDRNVNLISDPQKLFKYRKFSSNAELQQEELCSSVPLKQKMLSMQMQRDLLADKKTESVGEKQSVTVWMLEIRRWFGHEGKKSNRLLLLQDLLDFIKKIDKEDLAVYKTIVEPFSSEVEITKAKLMSILTSFFSNGVVGSKYEKQKKIVQKLTFLQVSRCILQFQIKLAKNGNACKNKSSSSEEHEEPIETARFQEGNDEGKKNKKLEACRVSNDLSIRQFYDSNKTPNNESIDKKDVSNSRNKQTLVPSLSPFNMNESKSYSNSRSLLQQYDSEPVIYKKGSIHSRGEGSLGMLTLQGRSPRELMQSQIYESMQRFGISGQKNNISFSLENIEGQPFTSFEHTVQSFEQILKKVKIIQANYQIKLAEASGNISVSDDKSKKEQQPAEEVILFLQQLINYRIAVNSDYEFSDSYTYFVSFTDIRQFKQHSLKIMIVLLQSAYIRQYFTSLQGIKIQNSPFLYKSVEPLLHHNFRIINLSRNGLSNINGLLKNMTTTNSLQFLNLNYNCLTDISIILSKFPKLRQLHAKGNIIQKFQGINNEAIPLQIIDLAQNLISEESDLIGVSCLKSLQILNLFKNPILAVREWKSNWKGTFNLSLVYQIDVLYMMSAFGHQKDVSFESHKDQVRKENLMGDMQVKIREAPARRLSQNKSNKQNRREMIMQLHQSDMIETKEQKEKVDQIKKPRNNKQMLKEPPLFGGDIKDRQSGKQKISKIKFSYMRD